MNHKRILFGLLISICLTAALTGCGPTAYDQGKEPAALSPAPTNSPAMALTETVQPPKTASRPPTTGKPMTSPTPSPAGNVKSDSPLKIDHIVVVIEENHSYKQVAGNEDAPYIQSLIDQGTLFTNAHGVTHPSQPNYLALFSGSTQGVTSDACKKPFSKANLASELLDNKLTFTGYSEDLPKSGYSGCSSKQYARKHNPWVQFTNVPKEANRPFSDFPRDFSKLPTVSFVIPNEKHDMHSGTIRQADDWLKSNLAAYVSWAQTHNSLLIITWDEDDFSKKNQIPVIFVGPMVKQGKIDQKIDHYSMLKLIEEVYDLPQLGESKKAASISSVWK